MSTKRALEAEFRQMFNADTARIVKTGDKMFLLIGEKRNTKQDAGQWYKDGKPYDFNYVAEKVIASGKNEEELRASAKEYQRLCGLTMEEYLREKAL